MIQLLVLTVQFFPHLTGFFFSSPLQRDKNVSVVPNSLGLTVMLTYLNATFLNHAFLLSMFLFGISLLLLNVFVITNNFLKYD